MEVGRADVFLFDGDSRVKEGLTGIDLLRLYYDGSSLYTLDPVPAIRETAAFATCP